MLETQREHIEGLQKLDRASRNEKKAIDKKIFHKVSRHNLKIPDDFMDMIENLKRGIHLNGLRKKDQY